MESWGEIKRTKGRVPRWRMTALTAAAIVVDLVMPTSAHATLFGGVCPLMTLTVTYSPAVRVAVPTGNTTVDITGSGSCVALTGTMVTATLSGDGTTTPSARVFTCLGGAVVGSGNLTVTGYPGFPSGQSGTLVIAMAAGVGDVALVSPAGTVVAAGVFLQETGKTRACATDPSGVSSASWLGVLVFGAVTVPTIPPP